MRFLEYEFPFEIFELRFRDIISIRDFGNMDFEMRFWNMIPELRFRFEILE